MKSLIVLSLIIASISIYSNPAPDCKDSPECGEVTHRNQATGQVKGMNCYTVKNTKDSKVPERRVCKPKSSSSQSPQRRSNRNPRPSGPFEDKPVY